MGDYPSPNYPPVNGFDDRGGCQWHGDPRVRATV